VWKVTVRAEDAFKGEAVAPVTAVFFSAFGCPTCSVFKDAPDKLIAKYGKSIKIVWKHKVVPAPNPDSMDASTASLAAKAQGKFWQYHDLLFSSGQIGVMDLENHAKALGLDIPRFRKDTRGNETRKQALQDALLANSVGAHSMPNILVNGVRMSGPKTYENLVALIDRELPKAQAKIKAGTAVEKLYDTTVAGGKSFEQLGPQVSTSFRNDTATAIGPKDAKIQLVVFEDFQ